MMGTLRCADVSCQPAKKYAARFESFINGVISGSSTKPVPSDATQDTGQINMSLASSALHSTMTTTKDIIVGGLKTVSPTRLRLGGAPEHHSVAEQMAGLSSFTARSRDRRRPAVATVDGENSAGREFVGNGSGYVRARRGALTDKSLPNAK